jgi:hypothetical protein
MRILVVELRTGGQKRPKEEIANAQPHDGELFIEGSAAYLCGGRYPGDWPRAGHMLPPLYYARVRRLRGDEFVIVGEYLRDGVRIHEVQPQAWWCRLVAESSRSHREHFTSVAPTSLEGNEQRGSP